MGRFNKYSAGVGAERRAEKKYLQGAVALLLGLPSSWISRDDFV